MCEPCNFARRSPKELARHLNGAPHAQNLRDMAALEIDRPSLSWMQHDLPLIVEMADLQPHESVLIVACGTGQLILEIVRASNGNHGRMVGVDNSRHAVQIAIQKLDD